ncbi:30S ribosomal protein S5 [Candidatus Woesearchaeota archaeon]|nr:30S ribosomal protein S5 [Candidatus Woesearchaeota archaeon]
MGKELISHGSLAEQLKPEIERELGKKVKEGQITDIEDIFKQGLLIQEAQITDTLLPELEEDLLLIGKAKGKFGGGQRRVFRQTQKKTKEGNKIHFTTYVVVGNKNGYVGGATGTSKETVPSRDKAKRNARLSIIRVRRGCGSWQCGCKEAHSIPFTVEGRCSSARIVLMPAPKGKGLCVEKECAKVLALAGIKDVWSKTYGQTKTKLSLLQALFDALKNLSKIKIHPEDVAKLGLVDGKMKDSEGVVIKVEFKPKSEERGGFSSKGRGQGQKRSFNDKRKGSFKGRGGPGGPGGSGTRGRAGGRGETSREKK